MLSEPKGFNTWVHFSSHQYHKNGLLAGLGWGFHPKITLWNQQKTKFIIVKRAKEKTLSSCSSSTKWPMQAILSEVLPFTATPKWVTKMGN